MPSVYREPTFRVGDTVTVDWRKDGNPTRHRIVGINWHARGCSSGIMLKVDPLVSRGVWWIDSGWIQSVEKA